MNKEEIIKTMIRENSYERFDLGDGWQGEIKRHPDLLHLCGYVYVPRDSVLWGMSYDDVYDLETSEHEIDVHGSLTYSGEGHNGKESKEWCFGFDCSHFGDISGYMLFDDIPMSFALREYRDFDYVKKEVMRLYGQLKAIHDIQELKL